MPSVFDTFPDQRTDLVIYIRARLAWEAEVDEAAGKTVGVDQSIMDSWGWVQRNRQRRTGVLGLLRLFTEQVTDRAPAERGLMYLASMWAADPPVVDKAGRFYSANTGGLTYLTPCCRATPTYSGPVLCCRACYSEIDLELGWLPAPAVTDRPAPAAGRR